MTPGLSSFPQLPLGIRARALQRKEPQCSGDVEARSSCLLKPAEAQRRNLCWDAGMSHGPRGQGVQLAWNQELGSQALGRVRFLSGAAGVSPHLPPQTSSLSQGAHGRKRPSHPSSEKLFCLSSIKAPLRTRSSSPKRSRLAQPGQKPTSGPCSEGAGLGVGWARHCWEQAGHGKGVWTGQSPPGHLVGRKESPLSFFRSSSARCVQTEAIRSQGGCQNR